MELRDRNPLDVAYLASAYAVAGNKSEAHRLLVEIEGRSRREYVPPTVLAIAHIGLGQHERAFDCWTGPSPNTMDGSPNLFSIQPTTLCARTPAMQRCCRRWD